MPYCIDKEHKLYGKRLIEDRSLPLEDGSSLYIDAETDETTDLKKHQVGYVKPPIEPEKPSL